MKIHSTTYEREWDAFFSIIIINRPFTNNSNVNINSSTWIGSSTTVKERKPVLVNFLNLFFYVLFVIFFRHWPISLNPLFLWILLHNIYLRAFVWKRLVTWTCEVRDSLAILRLHESTVKIKLKLFFAFCFAISSQWIMFYKIRRGEESLELACFISDFSRFAQPLDQLHCISWAYAIILLRDECFETF